MAYVIVWLACTLLAYLVGTNTAPSKAWLAAVLGFMLGPLGVLIACFLKE